MKVFAAATVALAIPIWGSGLLQLYPGWEWTPTFSGVVVGVFLAKGLLGSPR